MFFNNEPLRTKTFLITVVLYHIFSLKYFPYIFHIRTVHHNIERNVQLRGPMVLVIPALLF